MRYSNRIRALVTRKPYRGAAASSTSLAVAVSSASPRSSASSPRSLNPTVPFSTSLSPTTRTEGCFCVMARRIFSPTAA
jgi:hypothetical protein